MTSSSEVSTANLHPLRECDLIMKGGITSGVIYPRAAVHLAKTCRFRNVGGASAGAIAASMVAAAEYGRDSAGFEKLNQLPTDLGADLKSLFQPSPETEPMHPAVDLRSAMGTAGSGRLRADCERRRRARTQAFRRAESCAVIARSIWS